tara:strand:+ start:1850 stop:2296 length:447 start_codon:yes stop_codon:yes gene_type:complete
VKDQLFLNNKIEIRKSPIHGFGVFAKENIKSGELLEECSYAKTIIHPLCARDYLFNWPKEDNNISSIVFGFGSIYNCAKSEEKRLVDWEYDEEVDLYIFKTIKNITANTELLIYYGSEWWKDSDSRERQKEFRDKIKNLKNGIYTDNL